MAKNEPQKIAKLVKSLAAIVLIVAASVGGTLFYSTRVGQTASSDKAAPEPKPETAAKPIFTPLEPFTVTLRTERNNRILYVAITLRLEDEPSRRLIVEYMPEVRDRILRVLSEQKADHVQTPEGRASLVALIKEKIEEPYLPQPQGPGINAVLFTAFVIQ